MSDGLARGFQNDSAVDAYLIATSDVFPFKRLAPGGTERLWRVGDLMILDDGGTVFGAARSDRDFFAALHVVDVVDVYFAGHGAARGPPPAPPCGNPRHQLARRVD
jgi:hypothetical protein